MTKRVIIFILLISILLFSGCSKTDTAVQSTDSDTKATVTKGLSDFKKADGMIQVQEGIVVDLPSGKDEQAVANSIDPKTGAPTKSFQAKAGDKIVQRKQLAAEDTGKTLDVPYVSDNGKDIAIYDPVTTIQLTPIPGTIEYLVGFDNTIYITDWKKSTLKKFLKDEVDGYNKNVFMGMHFRQDS